MMGKAIKLSNCESGGSDYFLLMPMFMIYNRGDFDFLDNLDELDNLDDNDDDRDFQRYSILKCRFTYKTLLSFKV